MYDEIKRLRKESAKDRELKRRDRSRALPERFSKNYSHAVQSTKTKNFIEPENFEEAINSEQKDKWLEAMKTEIESLNETETWDLVLKEKGQILFLANGCTKLNMIQTEILISLKLVLSQPVLNKLMELNIRILLLQEANLKHLKFY